MHTAATYLVLLNARVIPGTQVMATRALTSMNAPQICAMLMQHAQTSSVHLHARATLDILRSAPTCVVISMSVLDKVIIVTLMLSALTQ